MPRQLDSAARSRRDFLKTAGLFGGMAAAGWPALGHGQGLKAITASHSVSTVVYGQHLVAAQEKFFEEEGLKTPDFIVPGGGAKVVQALAAGQVLFAFGYLIIQSLGTLNAADMMVALVVLGAIGIVMALGIRQIESRLLRWRPEYQKR